MKGVIVVGDAAEGEVSPPDDNSGADGSREPTEDSTVSDDRKLFFAVMFGVLGFVATVALLPELVSLRGVVGRWTSSAGNRVHRANAFRNRPITSMVLGWATIGLILLVGTAVALGLWTATGGGILFLGSLAVLAVLVVAYAASSAGVGLPSVQLSVPHDSRPRTARSSRRIRSRPPSRGSLETNWRRTEQVIRGWLTVAVLLGAGAFMAIAIWKVTSGGIQFVAGLVVIGLILLAYAISSSR